MKKYAILLVVAYITMPYLMAGDEPLTPTNHRQKYIGKTAKAAPAVVYCPRKETAYEYENGQEVLLGTYTYTYDERGNRLTDYINGGYYTLEYDELNRVIARTPESHNYEKNVFAYDHIVSSYIIDKQNFIYDSWDEDFTEKTYQHHVDVIRDEQGKITGWARSILDPGSEKLDVSDRVTITYGADGNAVTWKMGSLVMNEKGELVMIDDYYRYDNIQWQNTDHQIIYEPEQFVIGANRVKRADLYVKGKKYGDFTATYTNAEDFVAILTTIDSLRQEHSYQITDTNGSYIESFDEQGIEVDEDGKEHPYHITDRIEVKYDKYGNTTENLVFVDEEMQTSQRYEHTYGEQGQLLQTIEYMYDSEKKQWHPFMRIEFDDFIAFTPSGVDNTTANATLQAFVTDGSLHLSGADMIAYTLYGMNGAAIMHDNIAADHALIDIASLSNGVYIAAVSTAQGTTERVKFVK